MQLAYLHYLSAGETALNHVEQFATAARELGHRVDVHAIRAREGGQGTPPASGPPPRSGDRLLNALRRYSSQPRILAENLSYLRREKRLLRASPPDLILARDNLLLFSCLWTARRLELPLVLEINAPVIESTLFHREYAQIPLLPGLIEGWKLRGAAGVVVVSEPLKAHLVEHYGVRADKIAVAPNGADLERFHPRLEADPALPAEFAAKPVVGFVGSFEAWHGAELLAEMVREVGRRRPEARFLFVGDGPDLESFRAATAELGGRALFTGRVPHARVPGLVAAFDVGVVAETGFYMSPLKVFEWMAAGKAVVAPGYEPLRQIIRDGTDGLLFEPRDPGELVGAVLRLLDDAELRRALGSAATERAHASFSWTRNAQTVLACCERALASHRRDGSSDAG